jgi:hypothetical protein
MAILLDGSPGSDTALARIPIIEDGVIEHDARSIAGYELIGGDRTDAPYLNVTVIALRCLRPD